MNAHGVSNKLIAPLTEEQLPGKERFKACVLSFFDGMHHHHQQLLAHGSNLCDADRSKLLVIMAHTENTPTYTPGRQEVLLTPGERIQMLLGMGYEHVLPWAVPHHHQGAAHIDWPAGAAIMDEKTDKLVPGADIWTNPHFKRLVEQTRKQQPGLTQKTDNSFFGQTSHEHEMITNMIASGEVAATMEKLGYAYPLGGHVVEGNKIGRTLGYPTANLRVAHVDKVIPGQGVYVALVQVEGHWHQAMVNIGIRPTLDMENVTIEANLFNFNKDIYGQWITIGFLSRIRDEMRFSSLAALKNQLDRDRENAKDVLRQLVPQTTTGDFVTAAIKWS